MKVQGINHITINTKDMKATADFYGRILGWKQMETVPFDGFSLVYFQIPGGGRLELFDYGGKNPVNQRDEAEAGLRHLAFTVDNVDEAEKMLRARGVTVTMAATDLPSLNSRAILFLDPNGVTLEFCQSMKR
jgi:catechol 2,3-dioxygenase-like lactoylglutathione lyase family enzyme